MDNIKGDENALKAKLRSCSALNTFCHEKQQEIANLTKQIYLKDVIIADLKSRLGKYETTCITAEGQEPVLLGPSQSLVESLCKEICKLKQKMKESEKDAAQTLESNTLEIQRLEELLKEKDQELESIRQRPEHEKEREIQQLRLTLAKREQAQATREVLCTSLAEEAEKLRSQLGATVRVCQGLLGRLAPVSKMTDSSEVAHVNSLVYKLQEENESLKKRVEYVENLNAKWQKYDSSREEYVRALCQKLKDSNGLASPGPGHGPTTVTGLGLLPPAATPGLLQEEIARLNRHLKEKVAECERLGRERDDRARRDQERIQMLEQQVLAYTEDFNSERADRERAQGKILDLQEELRRLQIHSQSPREATATCRVHASRRNPTCQQTDTAEPLQRSSPERPATNRTGIYPQLASTWNENRGSADLQCPHCATKFDETHCNDFLNHCEECAGTFLLA
ncbi:TNFAIP3-interacting protein 2 [Chanos chanos]|uniref:TNFAIP3-interacting protein 2 n=1 Tax=Chanos chanos TaxID=29144 RepID=A0A6J2WFA9_CHACN|nr:TNFAIP3-interacting protein 2 [Chanos chanos]